MAPSVGLSAPDADADPPHARLASKADRQHSLSTLLVLRAFLEDPGERHYGLRLIEASGVTAGGLYPILSRLEQQGWIAGEWEQLDETAAGRRRRRYFQLTQQGREIAESVLRETVAALQPPADPAGQAFGTGLTRSEDRSTESRSTTAGEEPGGGRLFGRDEDLAAVAAELACHRVVVLTGPAGVGKTRLARELAHRSAATFPDGVHVVELGLVNEAGQVEQAVAAALGVCERPRRGVVGSIVQELRERRLLLLLDNCEHVADICSDLVAAVVEACPDVSILATSQVSLRSTRASVWPVTPLHVPGPEASVAAMRTSPAVSLFCARAAAARPGFSAEGDGLRVVADICRQLDGVPLAIELAAARVVVLTPTELAAAWISVS